MDPVHTEDCDVVYKGPDPSIGDLWCHRVQPGWIRVTYQPNQEEIEVLNSGGRVRLHILGEPIKPIRLEVATKESSEPIGPHGWKVDVEPGDVRKALEARAKLKEAKNNGESKDNSETQVDQTEIEQTRPKESPAKPETRGSEVGEAAKAVSTRASLYGGTGEG